MKVDYNAVDSEGKQAYFEAFSHLGQAGLMSLNRFTHIIIHTTKSSVFRITRPSLAKHTRNFGT